MLESPEAGISGKLETAATRVEPNYPRDASDAGGERCDPSPPCTTHEPNSRSAVDPELSCRARDGTISDEEPTGRMSAVDSTAVAFPDVCVQSAKLRVVNASTIGKIAHRIVGVASWPTVVSCSRQNYKGW